MKKSTISAIALSLAILVSGFAQAQAIEGVYTLKYDSTRAAVAAIDTLFEDDDLSGSKITLYSIDFGGNNGATHIVVADYDNYASRDELDQKRVQSHGWSKYLLATQGTELVAAELAVVVDAYGKARHEAGYLVAFIMKIDDVTAYRAALQKLNSAVKGSLGTRLLSLRSGPSAASHVVLLGSENFAAANEYLDKMYASDGFAEFIGEVSGIRTLVSVEMLRREGTWGY